MEGHGMPAKVYMARLPAQADLANYAKQYVDDVLIAQIQKTDQESQSQPTAFLEPPTTLDTDNNLDIDGWLLY